MLNNIEIDKRVFELEEEWQKHKKLQLELKNIARYILDKLNEKGNV